MEKSTTIPQVKAHLEPLTQGAVEAMHSLRDQRIERRVRKITKGDLTSGAEIMAMDYIRFAASQGILISDAEIETTLSCNNPLKALIDAYSKIKHEVDVFKENFIDASGIKSFLSSLYKRSDDILDQFMPRPLSGKRKPIEKIHSALFGPEKRLYFRLRDESDSLVQDQIVEYLKTALGAETVVTDEVYRSGVVIDSFKRERKIGSLLDSNISYGEALRHAFQDDPVRVAADLVRVLSQHKIDIGKIAHVGNLRENESSYEERLRHAFQKVPRLVANSISVALCKRSINIMEFHYIGALYKEKKNYKESLRQAFQGDPVFAAQDLVVVLSRHPLDIARASYKRGWESCQTNTKNSIEDGARDAKEGVLVAYLVKGDDPDISDPLVRVKIKPYHLEEIEEDKKQDKSPVVFRAFKPIGRYHPGFYKAVVNFIEERINHNSFYGRYVLPRNFESHREAAKTYNFSKNPKENLRMLGHGYTVSPEEEISALRIDLRFAGLNVLPDFSSVRVQGTFDCSSNNICDLKGSPQNAMRDFTCVDTMISTFEGAPPVVREKVKYVMTPYLSSLAGIPQAATYIYGNRESLKGIKTSPKPSVRTVNIALFPRFRK